MSCGVIDAFKTERLVAWNRERTGLSARVALKCCHLSDCS